MEIDARPLNAEAYKDFGAVIASGPAGSGSPANQGTATRYNHLAELVNRRLDTAKANICLFRSTPAAKLPFEIKFLERHAFSTQVFIPMGSVRRYLVIVCLGGEEPDVSTLRAFLAEGTQGVSYNPGVWHHPLIALDRTGDFTSFVYEDGSEKDCFLKDLPQAVLARIPK